jgi:hypothetical protein
MLPSGFSLSSPLVPLASFEIETPSVLAEGFDGAVFAGGELVFVLVTGGLGGEGTFVGLEAVLAAAICLARLLGEVLNQSYESRLQIIV